MGVEFYHCDCCEESRYEEYVGRCDGCGHKLCTACVVNDDIGSSYANHYGERYSGTQEQKERLGIEEDWEEKGWVTLGEVIDDVDMQPKYCPFCQGEAFDEVKFHNWLYDKLNRTKSELIEEFIKSL